MSIKSKILALVAFTLLGSSETISGQSLQGNQPNPHQPQQGRPAGASAPNWAQDLARRIQIDAYAQGGFTYEHTGGKDNNTFDIKRAMIIAALPITDRWFAFFMHDISSEVQEYYTSYRVTNNKAFNVKLGQFKNALTYENSQPAFALEAISLTSEGVGYLAGCGSDRLLGTQYGRDLGLELFGETNSGKLKYTLAVMNGQGVNKKDGNNEKDFIGKLEYRPTSELNFIVSGQLGRGHAVERSIYNPDIQVGDNYKRNRWTAGFAYNSRPIRLRGEYVEGKDGDVTSRGAYVTTAIPVAPKLELVGSYDFFNYNIKAHMDQHKAILGFQYWFYKNCRFQVQYVYKSASLQDHSFVTPGGDVVNSKVFTHGANHAILCQMQVRLK